MASDPHHIHPVKGGFVPVEIEGQPYWRAGGLWGTVPEQPKYVMAVDVPPPAGAEQKGYYAVPETDLVLMLRPGSDPGENAAAIRAMDRLGATPVAGDREGIDPVLWRLPEPVNGGWSYDDKVTGFFRQERAEHAAAMKAASAEAQAAKTEQERADLEAHAAKILALVPGSEVVLHLAGMLPWTGRSVPAEFVGIENGAVVIKAKMPGRQRAGRYLVSPAEVSLPT